MIGVGVGAGVGLGVVAVTGEAVGFTYKNSDNTLTFAGYAKNGSGPITVWYKVGGGTWIKNEYLFPVGSDFAFYAAVPYTVPVPTPADPFDVGYTVDMYYMNILKLRCNWTLTGATIASGTLSGGTPSQHCDELQTGVYNP